MDNKIQLVAKMKLEIHWTTQLDPKFTKQGNKFSVLKPETCVLWLTQIHEYQAPKHVHMIASTLV